MTETIPPPQTQAEPPHTLQRPATDEAALRAIEDAAHHIKERALAIRANPEAHKPRLVLSKHVRGTSVLDRIADAVNVFCGSMWVFIFITVGIVVWLFAGNIIGFDKTPWPLLLTILNLPQLSIMISLQVSANRAQAASDRRAIADHETLIALHEMAKQQLDILNGQDRVLDILHNFASKDMPGRQSEIQDCVNKILATVEQHPGAGQPAAG
jgi:Low affinity iron permease